MTTLPRRSSLTSLAAFSPSSRKFLSIILLRSTAALSSVLKVHPILKRFPRSMKSKKIKYIQYKHARVKTSNSRKATRPCVKKKNPKIYNSLNGRFSTQNGKGILRASSDAQRIFLVFSALSALDKMLKLRDQMDCNDALFQRVNLCSQSSRDCCFLFSYMAARARVFGSRHAPIASAANHRALHLPRHRTEQST